MAESNDDRYPDAQPRVIAAAVRTPISGTISVITFVVGAGIVLGLVSLWILNGFQPGSPGLNGIAVPGNRTSTTAAAEAVAPTMPTLAGTPGPGYGVPIVGTTTPATTPSASPAQRPTTDAAPIPVPSSLGEHLNTPTSMIDQVTAPSPTVPLVGSNSPVPSPSTPASTAPSVLPVNAPGSGAHIEAVTFSAGDNSSIVVTLSGLRPAAGTPANASIDWGDGGSRPNQMAAPAASEADPNRMAPPVTTGADPTRIDLNHSYSGPGTYRITWGDPSDPAHSWTHTITLSSAIAAAPMQQLTNAGTVDGDQAFSIGGLDLGTAAAWTLDYGDGSYSSGAGAAPTDDQLHHHYTGSGHLAVLTVVGSDGQLSTSSVNTP